MISRGCLLAVAVACLLGSALVSAVLIWGAEAVAAFLLACCAGVGVTVCLAMMAGGDE